MTLVDLINVSDQNFFGAITNSATHNVSDAITINNGISEEEPKFYKEAISKLEEQNNKLTKRTEEQENKIIALLDKLSGKIK